MSLPIFQSGGADLQSLQKAFSLMQTGWAKDLNPVISFPINQGSILKNVSLTTGANTINHLLGRKLQGWFPVRIRDQNTTFYDQQDSNTTPQLTLKLVASANVVIDLMVF